MEHRFCDGWPGIVGLVVLVAGIAFLHGEPHVTEVGGFLQGEFQYTTDVEPDLPIDAEDAGTIQVEAEAALRTMAGVAGAASVVTVVGTFETAEQAALALEDLDLGAGEARLRWGQLAIVMSPHVEGGRTHSLVSAMGTLTDHVVTEGDQFNEDAIVVDLRCEASDRRTAAALADAIAEYAVVPTLARPPWIGPALTDDERLARSTFARWNRAWVDAVQGDWSIITYAQRLTEAGSAAERAAVQAELVQRIAAQPPSVLAGPNHDDVIAWLTRDLAEREVTDRPARDAELARLMGPIEAADLEAPTWHDRRFGATIGSVQAADRRLRIGWLMFDRFAAGLPAFVDHLGAAGCAAVRIGLHRFNDVRGD
jgi:hypothetical protein